MGAAVCVCMPRVECPLHPDAAPTRLLENAAAVAETCETGTHAARVIRMLAAQIAETPPVREHGEQTPNVIVRRVEPELMRIEISMPAWVTPTRHGICGDRSQGLIMTNGLIDVATCELTAGHLGMHSSGDGRHWIHQDMTTAATEGDTE